MSNLDFPTNPIDDQLFPDPVIPGLPQFKYNLAKGAWDKLPEVIDDQNPLLILSDYDITIGSYIKVSWANIDEVYSTDVISAHYVGGLNTEKIYVYTNSSAKKAGFFSLQIEVTSPIVFRYLRADNTLVVESAELTINTGTPTVTAEITQRGAFSASQSLTKTVGYAGDTVTVFYNFIASPNTATDTVVVVNRGASISATPLLSNVPDGQYTGSIVVNDYDFLNATVFRYMRSGSLIAESNSISISALPAPTLTLSSSTITFGGSVTVSWTNVHGAVNTDKIIALYEGNVNSTYFQIMSAPGTSSGSITFTNLQVTGRIIFRYVYLSNSSYLTVVESPVLTVQNLVPTIVVNPDEVVVGNYVEVSWSNIIGGGAGDIIGLIAQGSPNNAAPIVMYSLGDITGLTSSDTPGPTVRYSLNDINLSLGNGIIQPYMFAWGSSNLSSWVFRYYLNGQNLAVAESNVLSLIPPAPPAEDWGTSEPTPDPTPTDKAPLYFSVFPSTTQNLTVNRNTLASLSLRVNYVSGDRSNVVRYHFTMSLSEFPEVAGVEYTGTMALDSTKVISRKTPAYPGTYRTLMSAYAYDPSYGPTTTNGSSITISINWTVL